MSKLDKIFIIGLPRTGTTSLCSALLDLNFSVAHTAYTERTFLEAQAIADTPVFNDFQALDKAYPGAKFIYLQRSADKWVPSIKQLLSRMQRNLLREDGGFNPIIKRCYLQTFQPFSIENIESNEFLKACYLKHQQQVNSYFTNRANDLLSIDISQTGSYKKLCQFLDCSSAKNNHATFEKLNTGGKVTAWKDIVNANKVESTNKGRVTKLPYTF